MTGLRQQDLRLLSTDNWAVESDRICLFRLTIVLTGAPSDMYDGGAGLVEDMTLASNPVGFDDVKA